jgi:hypothetical protein
MVIMLLARATRPCLVIFSVKHYLTFFFDPLRIGLLDSLVPGVCFHFGACAAKKWPLHNRYVLRSWTGFFFLKKRKKERWVLHRRLVYEVFCIGIGFLMFTIIIIRAMISRIQPTQNKAMPAPDFAP